MTYQDGIDIDQPRKIIIPYVPRKHFIPVHTSVKRWKHMVAHRRAGKSVFEVNDMVKKALTNTRQIPPPRYAYIGPTFAQAKDLVWGYVKHYTGVIPGMAYSESELHATFPTGARITLYGGSSAHERMRGLYFDGVAMDEYPLLHPDAFNSVVRPALADYKGWAIVSGTSNGSDHFYELRRYAEANPDEWDVFDIKVTDTDALDAEEVAAARRMMTASAFAREFLNAFDAPVEGAYYADQLNAAETEGRICDVPYDASSPVMVFWDLGIADAMSLWFVQRIGRALHVIDYYENTGKGLDFYRGIVKSKKYNYSSFIVPHDIRQRELGTGRSRYEIMLELYNGVADITICPNHRVDDRIAGTRSALSICYFDKTKTRAGLSALRAYQAQRIERHNVNRPKPLHNWASHGADSFGTGIMGLEKAIGWSSVSIAGAVSGMRGALRRNIKGLF